MSKWVWVVPEEKGGIRWYSDTLWKELELHAPSESKKLLCPTVQEIASIKPSLIHIQHEYGCFGSKVPGRYRFPRFLNALRKALPSSIIIATAHTVIHSDYRYPVRGRRWQAPFRAAANIALMPALTHWWNSSTWRKLDGVVVQSSLFINTVKKSGCPIVREFPLFVPEAKMDASPLHAKSTATIIVFGYFSNDKGQDIAIQAMANLPASYRLILAGGVRRPEDQAYFDRCQALIRTLRLEDRITTTGYVSDADMDHYYQSADLVLAPFRESMGTGSVGQAFARAKAVLASDLDINRELVLRVPGCLDFFRSESPQDCAEKIQKLFANEKARQELSTAGHTYARKFSVSNSIRAHLDFYEELEKLHLGKVNSATLLTSKEL